MDAGVRAPRAAPVPSTRTGSSASSCIFRRSANPRSLARWGVAQSLEGWGDLQGAIAQYEALRGDAGDPAYVTEKIERLRAVSGSREGQVLQFINTVSTERVDAPHPARRRDRGVLGKYGEGAQRSRGGCSGTRMLPYL